MSERPYERYIRPEEDGPDISLYVQAVSDDAKAWFEAQKAVKKVLDEAPAGSGAEQSALLRSALRLLSQT